MDISKKYEINYNGLSSKDKKIVDKGLEHALYINNMNICTECAKKLFAFDGNIDLTKDSAIISQDFAIGKLAKYSDFKGELCVCGECQNESQYTLSILEEEQLEK